MKTARSKGRRLAAPMIVTVSLSAFAGVGCGEKTEPKGPMVNPPGPDWKPKGEGGAGGAETGSETGTDTGTDAGAVIAETSDAGPSNSNLPPMPTSGPGFLRVAGARCLWFENSSPPACPPNVPCNPPPPVSHDVQCPQPKNPLFVTRRDNGSCFFNYSKPSTCPPQTRCNPPPPLKVPTECPPEE